MVREWDGSVIVGQSRWSQQHEELINNKMFPGLLFLLVAGKCKFPWSDKDKMSLIVKTWTQIPPNHQSHTKSGTKVTLKNYENSCFIFVYRLDRLYCFKSKAITWCDPLSFDTWRHLCGKIMLILKYFDVKVLMLTLLICSIAIW